MKTKDQIIESYQSFNQNTGRCNERPMKICITSAMQDYANQQLEAYKAKLKLAIDEHQNKDLPEYGLQVAKDLIDTVN